MRGLFARVRMPAPLRCLACLTTSHRSTLTLGSQLKLLVRLRRCALAHLERHKYGILLTALGGSRVALAAPLSSGGLEDSRA